MHVKRDTHSRANMLDTNDLLQKTSRTFALAIPLLGEPTRLEVGLAYLLFRIADTFEDATDWPRADRVVALESFSRVLSSLDEPSASTLTTEWLARPPCTHAGYMELLGKTPAVLHEVKSLVPSAQTILIRHAVRTSDGMARVVMMADERGRLVLSSLQELQDYCYIVAGIVGELLTELFLHDAPQLESVRPLLEGNTRAFGEGLQLVNILKDSMADAGDGRTYLPASVPRAEVFQLARRDLDGAREYIGALETGKAPRGFVAFTALSVMLARAALDRLESAGAGSKVSREDVFAIFAKLQSTLDDGHTVRPLL
jgi:farnesyl-diphosphate farnesyltransferase